MSVLMDAPVQTVLSTYREAFDPVGLKDLRPSSQSCRGPSVIAATPGDIGQPWGKRVSERSCTLTTRIWLGGA